MCPLSFVRGVRMDVEALVGPVVAAAGLELWEVTYRKEGGRMVLRIAVDRDGGIGVDALSDLSERISRRLDIEPASPRGSYALEVTSPGLERALRTPGQFAWAVGRTVKVKTTEDVDGARVHEGVVLAADGAGLTLSTETGERRIAFDRIASARSVFVWGPAERRPA